jgi:acyl carrier protein
MDEIHKRLVKCFESAFRALPADEIPRASQATIPAWDSLATITLVNVIEDEFGVQLDFDLLPELNSFDRILFYMKTRVKG